MSTLKANLKNARDAIGSKNYEEALKWTQKVLDWEASNYNALVFAGLAYQNLGQASKGEESFKKAIASNPELPLARQGLINFYEKLERWDDLIPALEDMLQTHLAAKDGKKALSVTESLIKVYTTEGHMDRAIEKIQSYLPGTTLWELLDDKPDAIDTLTTLATIQEQTDSEFTEREVKLRRGRLGGGTLQQVQKTVRTELYNKSELGQTYEQILALDPENNKDLELKLLDFYVNKMEAVAGADQKTPIRIKALELATRMVQGEEGSASPMPYELLIKLEDASSPSDYDTELQEQYISKFPDTGLSMMIQAQLHYANGEAREDLLELLEDGFSLEPAVPFGYLVLCWMDYDAHDYESGLEHATAGRNLVVKRVEETGFPFEKMRRSFELCMAHCHFRIDSKYAQESLDLYQGILKADKDNIEAHQGVGLVLCLESKYTEATKSFKSVLALDPQNITARSELGWICYLQKQFDQAEERLREVVEMTESPRALDLYRLGRIYYDMDGEYRTDSAYSHAQLIAAAKLDPRCAGAFTYLGHYYREVVQDHARAKRCYQQAFGLDPQEGDAGQHLSDYFMADQDLESAIDVYQRATEADRKANWALRRLGFAELIRMNYLDAMSAFQKLLRNDSKDALAWEGLAEAYRYEGRYMAALKAFTRTRDLLPESTMAAYNIASIHQKLGMYPEAIEHFEETLALAQTNGEDESGEGHVPSLMGIAESFLEQGREYFVEGYYGRAAESFGRAIDYGLRLLTLDGGLRSAWKLVGDACISYRSVPGYLHLCPFESLAALYRTMPEDTNKVLHFPPGLDTVSVPLLESFTTGVEGQHQLASGDVESTERTCQALDIIFTIAGLAYKRANILEGNQGHQAADAWYDIALTYYYRHENATKKGRVHTAETAKTKDAWLAVTMRCLKASLQFEETNAAVWNALGVAAMEMKNAKISQHAFIKAMEYDPKNAAPWSNLGFLYMLNSELDLAAKAFSMAQTLDPAFAPAWTGQACVAGLWGSASESTALFAHAFESSTASVSEANYGYALKTFQDVSGGTSGGSGTNLLVTPMFALQKYLEHRPRDVAGWNLMGLIRERFLQQEAAAESFLTAIRILEQEEADGVASQTGEHERQKMMLYHNLARSMLSIQDYASAIEAYEMSLALEGPNAAPGVVRTCKHLGAGLALYYAGELERSLKMFEDALAETESVAGLETSRDDVVVLLSQVLWALGGEEQRQVAKDELFRCVAQSPRHLPAIFGLAAMGLCQDDETLATAALKEVLKFSRADLKALDPGMKADELVGQYFTLLSENSRAIAALTKSVHQAPQEAGLWKRLAGYLSRTVKDTAAAPFSVVLATSRANLALLRGQQTQQQSASSLTSSVESSGLASSSGSSALVSGSAVLTALDLSRGYAHLSGSILLADQERQRQVSGWKNPKKDKIEDEKAKSLAKAKEAVQMAQRAIMAAPWDREAWQVVGVAVQELSLRA